MVTSTKLPLEDLVVDILGKAQRGLKLSNEELSDRTHISLDQIEALKSGEHKTAQELEALAKLAFALNLHPVSLCALAEGKWYPKIQKPFIGFSMFTTNYADMTVNAFLVWDPKTGEAATFDTGSSCQPILETIEANNLKLKRAFITHTHADHLADLERLMRETGATGYGSAIDNPLGLKPLRHQDGLTLGSLTIRVLATPGHTPGGQSYFINGLTNAEGKPQPLVVVGDAMFASSIGGAANAWEEALKYNRERILTLPPETIICPGHGPLSTVGEERAHNPFFPEFK